VNKQKIAACVAIVLMLCVFTACGESVPQPAEYHPLVLNFYGPAAFGGHEYRAKFWHDLTCEQIAAVLPGFERFATIEGAAAEYELDNWLNKVSVGIEQPDEPNNSTSITLTKDAVRSTETYSRDLLDFSYWEEVKGFTLSDVYGVPVLAECIDIYGDASPLEYYEFKATFLLNGIIYSISLCVYDPASTEYNAYLEMLVNEIILTSVKDGLIPDLSVLDNPENPGFRDDKLTLEQAYADPDFGAYLPRKVPEGFVVDYVWRIFSQTRNELCVCYRSPGAGATDFYWTVSEPSENDADNIFRAEDMSFETVMTRAYDGDSENVIVKDFGVLIDDVMIDIYTYYASPEQVWEILEQVISQ